MSYDLILVSFALARDGHPRGDEMSIIQEILAPYCYGGPCPPQEMTTGTDLESPREDWGAAYITGLDNDGLGINRPPVWDMEFLELLCNICCRADCFICEPCSGDFFVFTAEQDTYWRADGKQTVIWVHSPEELDAAYNESAS